MTPKKINNIIFDLGGVLLNLDYGRTISALESLGMKDVHELYTQAEQHFIFDQFERGAVEWPKVVETLNNQFDTSCSLGEVELAWNQMLLDFPIHRIEMLELLKTQYNLFLLSNNNETHYKACMNIIEGSHDTRFHRAFDAHYYSHEIGLRKPDAEIFQHVLSQQNIKPEETFFIDDSPQHVEASRKLGIESLWLEKGKDVVYLLRESGILT